MTDPQEGATAYAAVQMLASAANRGGRQKDVADAIGAEHGYLVNQIVHGIALGVIRKCRMAIRFEREEVASCGQIMYLLANGPNYDRDTPEWLLNRAARRDHPYHDGELTCESIRGALITLNCYDDGSWQRPTCWIWS